MQKLNSHRISDSFFCVTFYWWKNYFLFSNFCSVTSRLFSVVSQGG